jgi:uncharacterized protein (TIRG00374 family)
VDRRAPQPRAATDERARSELRGLGAARVAANGSGGEPFEAPPLRSDPLTCEPPAETTPHWMRWITRLSLVVGIVALVITIWLVGPSTILAHVRAIGWFFVLILATDVASSLCDATALYFMVHGPGEPTWLECVVAQLAGRGVSTVTPGGNLGEALKVSLLSTRCSPKRIVAGVMYVGLMLGVFSFAVIAIGSGATVFLFDMPPVAKLAVLVGAAVAAAIAVGIVVLMRHGMLSTLSNVLARLHLISKERRAKWNKTLEEIDTRLRGQDGKDRNHAIAFIAISQLLQKFLTVLVIFATGYMLSPGQFLALASAGVLLGWISTVIPFGLGISEGGNVALFSLIGAPVALGIALALARRVNQVVFAVVGFSVLMADRVGRRVHGRVRQRWQRKEVPA